MIRLAQRIIFAIGLLACPIATQAQELALPKSAPDMPGYLLVVGKTTNRAKISAYAAALPPIYARHNAYYLAIGGASRGVVWLEGTWQDRSIIFGKFPSRSEIDAFWWGADYREAIRMRDNAGVFSVVALNATVPTPHEGRGVGYLIVMTARRNTSTNQIVLSQRAAESLLTGVQGSGGSIVVTASEGQFTPMEGDTVFDHFTIASWATVAQRDAYLASDQGRRTKRLRAKLGLSAVASANGVLANAPPPAAAPT
jgi:uncharacterized protein (DUF1330 family)